MMLPEEPEYLNVRNPIPPGVNEIIFSTKEAPGAIPNDTVVEKIGSKPGDGHPDGSRAKVIGSAGPAKHPKNGRDFYGYWVIWDDIPDKPCFVSDERIRPVEE